jgi:ADP-heptose:LPS heptosyltransferase
MLVPRKILAVKLRALGDTILMTAPLAELRRAFPKAEIHVAVTSNWAELLEHDPAVDRVWPYVRYKDTPARAKAIARLALRLRRENFDCVVNFHASPSSATLAFATGARVRSIHFHGHGDKNRYSTVTVPGKGQVKPVIERDMDTLRGLGLEVPAGQLPRISLQRTEIIQAEDRLSRMRLTRPVLALGLGASRPTKSWPIERFAELALAWCRATGGSAIGLASAAEEELAREFLRRVDDALAHSLENAHERAGARARIVTETGLGLRQLAALVQHCSVFAGNDSGPRHLAVAVRTPTVTLFGPEHPFEWHPYPTETHPYFFIETLDCRKDAQPGMPPWCGLETCVEREHRCMRDIGIDAVLKECLRVKRK